ncbi:MAG TPA: asparagine synthase (glutamine-hydrolyzing) [Desulfotomaculum sp.]|nr:MAG: Asparagine synthetase [Desulfotomaculum sp. 46_296]HAG11620.1 asparagine synthase (glutamine-hydrolyzing) [Desulfotomaculum sp.]HBY04766.1 asparagine synthase (glutamine-hydrolyzing) [Desulfotomaculum sp.]
MCGITGWIDWGTDLTFKQPVVEEMNKTHSFRGPDAAGIWVSPTAVLAHRRLTVVDPEGGGQPMVRQSGANKYILVYNGELYNTAELRQELESRGYMFEGYSDTEALLFSFIEWGAGCLRRFNGIFAFAIWDESRRRLFCARDRLGVKPFFYAQRGSAFLFGSELKSLLAHPLVEPEIDAQGLAEIFVMGPARTPGCGVFRGIEELKPGYCLICHQDGIQPRQYWSLESRPFEDTLTNGVNKVYELLEDTVNRQLVSDVPVCVFLSGGLDSSAISAFASDVYARSGRSPLHTYSIDYLENDLYFKPNYFQPDPDTQWALMVSGYLGTKHHHVTINTPGLVDALTRAVTARDLPGMADIDASLYLFSKEIKKDATVALSGECADEIFGGYPWLHNERDLNAETFPWIRMVPERANILSTEIRGLIKPQEYVARRFEEAVGEVPFLPGEDPLEARSRKMLFLTMTRFMPMLLDRKDRMSMAAGLEVRVPFCDHRLVEYAWNIPWLMKSCDNMEKGILRRALAGVLPEQVLLRKKSPYPKTHHPDYLAAVRNLLAETINDPASPLGRLLDRSALDKIIATDAACFNPAWFSQLMGGAQLFAYLIQVDFWLREYKVSIKA